MRDQWAADGGGSDGGISLTPGASAAAAMHRCGELPLDVWHIIAYEHARPVDLCSLSCVCADLHHLIRHSTLWKFKLSAAATAALEGLASTRSLRFTRADVRAVVSDARRMGGVPESEAQDIFGGDHSATPSTALAAEDRAIFFFAVKHVATAAVALLAPHTPRLCLISFAQRAYDTTDFVHHHPGGAYHMKRHHGKDATPIFDAFAHSVYAHDMMRNDFLRFDAIAFVGRYGAPHFALAAVAPIWTMRREAAHFVSQLTAAVSTALRQGLGR